MLADPLIRGYNRFNADNDELHHKITWIIDKHKTVKLKEKFKFLDVYGLKFIFQVFQGKWEVLSEKNLTKPQ